MKKFDVVSIGGATLDIMFGTDQAKILSNQKKLGAKKLLAFELGSKIVSQDVIYTHGGGAANTAISLAKLGLKSAALTAIGRDASGQGLLNKFKKEKVDSAYVQKTSGYTGLSFVVTGGGKKDHVIFVHRSANDLLRIKRNTLENFQAKWYYISSLSGKHWRENLKIIFASAAKQKVKIAWNPGGQQLKCGYASLKKYYQQTEVLLLNKEEAISLAAAAGVKTSNLPKLLKLLHDRGPKTVAITEGAKGAVVYSAQVVCYAKALPFAGINTTGAGDAFGSSLVGGLMLYKNNLEKALKLAIIRSNYVVRKVGAQEGLLTLAEVKKLNYRI